MATGKMAMTCSNVEQAWMKASSIKPMSALIVVFALGACSQVPPTKTSQSKVDPVWGVEAPKKMIADGQPVPPGGGRYQVGKPYMVAGRMYFPREDRGYDKVGLASWYGSDFHGRETANGEVYDKDSLSAAHTTMPIPSYARVTNLDNGRSIIVRVNDRGPYVGDRLIDVSEKTAELLAFKSRGLSHVRVQYVGPAPVEGSDQRMLVASLRTTGTPTVAQDRNLIAMADRLPSDGRMTGLAAANLNLPLNAGEDHAKPVVLAAATEHQTSLVATTTRPMGYGPQTSLPIPAARPQVSQQLASATPAPVVARPQLPPNTLGTLSTRTLVPSGQVVSPAARPVAAPASATLAPLPPLRTVAPPVDLSARKVLPVAPNGGVGSIARAAKPSSDPILPSRYGPSGETLYKTQQSQGYVASEPTAPAVDAIDNLIKINMGHAASRIDLGGYARPENAARVADLMRPYGEISTSTVVGGLGEHLVIVRLTPSVGMIPGDVITIADQLGIHSATLID